MVFVWLAEVKFALTTWPWNVVLGRGAGTAVSALFRPFSYDTSNDGLLGVHIPLWNGMGIGAAQSPRSLLAAPGPAVPCVAITIPVIDLLADRARSPPTNRASSFEERGRASSPFVDSCSGSAHGSLTFRNGAFSGSVSSQPHSCAHRFSH